MYKRRALRVTPTRLECFASISRATLISPLLPCQYIDYADALVPRVLRVKETSRDLCQRIGLAESISYSIVISKRPLRECTATTVFEVDKAHTRCLGSVFHHLSISVSFDDKFPFQRVRP